MESSSISPAKSRLRTAGLALLFLAIATAVVAGLVFLLRDQTVYVTTPQRLSTTPSAGGSASLEPPPSLRQNLGGEDVPLPPLPAELAAPTADSEDLADIPFDVDAAVKLLRNPPGNAKPAPADSAEAPAP